MCYGRAMTSHDRERTEANLDQLRRRIVETTQASQLRASIGKISLEPAADDDGEAFLRVIIELADDRASPSELLVLLESIEDMISQIDDRYPSIRFSEAA